MRRTIRLLLVEVNYESAALAHKFEVAPTSQTLMQGYPRYTSRNRGSRRHPELCLEHGLGSDRGKFGDFVAAADFIPLRLDNDLLECPCQPGHATETE